MANIRFLYDNLYPASTLSLSTGSAASGLPLDASKSADRSYVFRSASTTGAVVIEIDLGSSQAVTAWAVANLRLFPSSGELKLYSRGTGGAPGAATLQDTLTSAMYDAGTKATTRFISVTARHWQLEFTNPGAVSTYVELGHAFLGGYFEPARNVTVPMDSQRIDPSLVSAGLDGQRTVASRTPYWVGSFSFAYLSQSDVETFYAMREAVSVGTPVYAVLDTAITWATWLCYFRGEVSKRFEENSSLYSCELPWEEAR